MHLYIGFPIPRGIPKCPGRGKLKKLSRFPGIPRGAVNFSLININFLILTFVVIIVKKIL